MKLTSLGLVALLCLARAASADTPVSLWQFDGEQNRIFLMGSIHLLRDSDHPLPSVLDDAFDEAERLVMELDMDDVDPVAMQVMLRERGLLDDDLDLETVMGPELWERAREAAEELEVPLRLFAQSEPWLAAMTIEQLLLQRLGFSAARGVEMTYAAKAAAAGKPVDGLESMEEQLGFLDELDLDAQIALLMQTLNAPIEPDESANEMVRAWREGDTAWFEENMLEDLGNSPELYATLLSDRNARWVDEIMKMLDDEDDYLIIVGTLHLVGTDGVPAMLERKGIDIRQLKQPE